MNPQNLYQKIIGDDIKSEAAGGNYVQKRKEKGQNQHQKKHQNLSQNIHQNLPQNMIKCEV